MTVLTNKENLLKNNIDDNSQLFWNKTSNILQNFYGQEVFDNWLSHIEFISFTSNILKLSVPTKFIREWINNNYISNILEIYKKEDNSIKFIEILVQPKQKNNIDSSEYQQQSVSGQYIKDQNINIIKENSENIHSNLDRRFTFENFVVSDSNEFAFAASLDFSKIKRATSNNLLYIHSKVGLGKTHLLHSIAWNIKKNTPNKKVVYMSAEKFMFQFINALRNNQIIQFKENFRHTDVLLIDDIQFVCGKENTQEEFCHTFNSLMDQKKHVVVSSSISPYKLEGIKEHIKSRLAGGLIVDIKRPSFDLCVEILKSKIKQIGYTDISLDVLEFIASNINSNIRELEGALNKVIAHSTLIKNKITLPWLESIFSDLLVPKEKVINILDIKNKVVKFYSIKLSDLSSSSRSRVITRPRQIAMFLCKKLTCKSLSEIGSKFGKRDHTTVIHAIKNIENLYQNNLEIKREIDSITSSIKR